MRNAALKFQPLPPAGTGFVRRRPSRPDRPRDGAGACAMSLGLGVVQLDITIVNTALSSIGTSLGGSVAELQWVVTAYTIAFAAFILTAGALGDRHRRQTDFHSGLCDLHVGFARCALAPSAS